MARPARIALDLVLVSLKTVRPVISKLWNSAKSKVEPTPVRPLLCNPVVAKLEVALNSITEILLSKLTSLRNNQFEGEIKYLEEELEKVKKKKSGIDGNKSLSKTLKPKLATMWQYSKVEIAPPMTLDFLKGPAGQKLENAVSQASNSFIASIENRIKQIDEEEKRKIIEKENAIKLEEEKLKLELKKKEEEKKRKEAEKQAQMVKKAKAKDEIKSKAKEEAKAKDKTKPKAQKPKTPPPNIQENKEDKEVSKGIKKK